MAIPKYAVIRSKKSIDRLLNARNFLTLEKRKEGFISQKDVDEINKGLMQKKLAISKGQGDRPHTEISNDINSLPATLCRTKKALHLSLYML